MKKLWKLLRNILIVCGVLFIIVLLLPDDEEMPADQEQTGVETAEGAGTLTGAETAAGIGMQAGAETAAGAAEDSFPEDMVKEKQAEIKGDGNDIATVLVYMNGSDLESEDGEATEDLCEMLAANISSQVNVLVETVGTKNWSKRLGIASDHTQRYKAEVGNLVLVDNMIAENEENDEESSTLALIDESYMKVLYTAWVDFAYANESELLGENYSMHVRGGRRAHPILQKKGLFDFLFDEDGEYSMSDYYITDIVAVAQNIESKEAEALSAAVNLAICYFNCTEDEVGMTGLSVTLPYGDSEFYGYLYPVFTGVGMDTDYVGWLEKFVYAEGYNDYYDYESWYEDDWEGWDDYEDDWDWIDWLFFDDDDYWEDDSWDEWGS